jgi:hypothetical protein
MRLSRLEFGSLLAYSPRGDSERAKHSRELRQAIKSERTFGDPPISTSEWVVKMIREKGAALPFYRFFDRKPLIVPAPTSSLQKAGSLWVPLNLSKALVEAGLGSGVLPCLHRTTAVPKAAYSLPKDRLKAAQHYATMAVQGHLSPTPEIVLVDDVLTRGATLLGAANRLADSYPNATIRAFAAMRTISNPEQFDREDKIMHPCVGTIVLQPSGETIRSP